MSQQPAKSAIARMAERCLRQWESVNDPPCHPSDSDWDGCPDCREAASDNPYEPSEQNLCAHEWVYTGTQYGGDDESFRGEGRCYCSVCGADGDA